MNLDLNAEAVTGPGGLLERLGTLTDPRSRQGRRHALAGVLAIAAAAVLGGARSYAAIAEFAAELPMATLQRLGTWRRPYSTRWLPPSEPTVRRTLQRVDGNALDRVVGGWLAEQRPEPVSGAPDAVAVDGKTLRGARQPDGQVHLLAALTHNSQVVLAQRSVGAKTNETTQLAPLLDEVDLADRTVTADALHTNAAEARYLLGRGADYVLAVKGNQPRLTSAIDHLPASAFSPCPPDG